MVCGGEVGCLSFCKLFIFVFVFVINTRFVLVKIWLILLIYKIILFLLLILLYILIIVLIFNLSCLYSGGRVRIILFGCFRLILLQNSTIAKFSIVKRSVCAIKLACGTVCYFFFFSLLDNFRTSLFIIMIYQQGHWYVVFTLYASLLIKIVFPFFGSI